jgi:acyl-CoA dehydrogenase
MAYWLLFFLIAIVALAYARAGIRATSIVLGAVVLFYGLFGDSWLAFGVMALTGVLVLLPLNLPVLRQEWLSRPLLARFRRMLTRLDERQVAALTATGSGWEAQLFDGAPDWARFHDDYRLRLTPDERALLDGPLAEFCSRYTRDPGTPAAHARLRAYGLHGLAIESVHGGRGLSALAQAAALARLAASTGRALAQRAGAPARLAWIDALQRHGTPAQQSRWLPLLADGTGLQTADGGAVVGDAIVEAGAEGPQLALTLDFALDDEAGIVGLCVDLRDPAGRLGPAAATGPTWLLLDAAQLRASPERLTTSFDAVIGGRERIGTAARQAAESRAAADAVAPVAIHAGAASALALSAGSLARLRGPFGESLGSRAMSEGALATLAARAWAAQALAAATARAVDLGDKPYAPAAFARTLALLQSRECAAAARDLGLDRGLLAARVDDVAEADDDGAEPTLLARPDVYSACVLRSHAAFMAALGAAQDPNPAAALTRFDDALWLHVGHLFGTATQAFALAFTAGSRLFGSATPEAQHLRRINRYSAALAFAADVALSLLARELGSSQPYTALRAVREASRRNLTTWLGDALAQLYLASAALRQFDEGGANADERAVLELICTDAFSACEEALDRLIRHLPSSPLAWITRFVVMPLGASRRAPRDAAQRTVAAQLQNHDSRLRERLGERVGLPADASPWPLLDAALAAMRAGEAIEQQLAAAPSVAPPRHLPTRIAEAEAAGLIDEAQARTLRDWLRAAARIRLPH